MSNITWFGHSAFRLQDSNTRVVIDPFFTKPEIAVRAENEGIDLVLVTHDHGDHLGNTVELCRRTGARLGAIVETARKLQTQGVPEGQIIGGGFNMGGTIRCGGVSVTMTQAYHSSESGCPVGYIIQMADGLTVYHAGDTCVFSDMSLWGKLFRIDIALLPIGGFYTMDYKQAVMACGLLKCTHVIPMHWGTFPVLEKTTDRFRSELEKEVPSCKFIALAPGESVDFSH